MPTGFCSCLSAAPETTHSSCVLFGWSSKSRRKSLAQQVYARHLSIGRVNHESISLSQVSLNLYLVWTPKWDTLVEFDHLCQGPPENDCCCCWQYYNNHCKIHLQLHEKRCYIHYIRSLGWQVSLNFFLGLRIFYFILLRCFFFSMASAKITCYC